MAGTIRRAKALRADLALWDGKTITASRPDATGGTTTGLRIGNEVDVLQVFGGGSARTVSTIRSAKNHIGTSECKLVFAPGTWTIDEDVTIDSNFSVYIPAGCVFSISNGVTLTFLGPVFSDHQQTITSGSGTLRATNAKGDIYQTAAEIAAGVTPSDRAYPGDGSRWYYSKRYALNADGSTDDSTNLNTLVWDGMNLMLSPDEFFIDANPGTEERGWIVHADNARIEGYNWSTTLKNNTANQSVINVGDASANERKSGNSVGWITFQDVPSSGSSGSDNNEHPLHFIAQNHPLAYFNRFINCGLGLRFGRARTAKGGDGVSSPTDGDGTRFGLAIGNYFEGMEGMSLEIMDDGSYGNQLICNRIASPGSNGNHTVRFNGNYNLVSALTALDGMSTLVSVQGGVGHVATGLVGTGQAQAIQSFNTAPDGTPAPKYSVVSGFAVGNTRDGATSYGARLSELTDFVLGPGVIYHASPNSSAAAGVYVLNNIGGSPSNADPRYCVIGPVITANTKGTTSFPHNFIQGYYHHINLIAHGADGGNASVFEIDDASGQCILDVSVERASSNPSDTDVRIEGAGHIGRIHGEKIIVSGSNHILDIVQPAGTAQGITINASDCILRIRATGPVVVNGDRNVITLMSSLASGTAITFNSGADNNLLMGLKDINMTDNGTGNTTTGMVTY